MKLGEATVWFLAGWAVTIPIAAPQLVGDRVDVRGFLFLALMGAVVAVLVGMVIDLITTIGRNAHGREQ